MNALTKARFERALYAVGAVAGWGLALAATVCLVAGIESIASNVLDILFGVAIGASLSVSWTQSGAKTRRLAAQAAQMGSEAGR